MKRIKTMLLAMVAVMAIGAVATSGAQAGIDAGSKVGLSGAYCDIVWSGGSLAPPATNVNIPANAITSSNCPSGVLSATNSQALSVSSTTSNATLNSGRIRVSTILGSCNITINSPISIPAVGTNHYVGSEPVTSSALTLSGFICPTSGTVDFDLLFS